MRAVITVVSKDRVGIIAEVTQALAHQNVNVLDITQTILPPTSSPWSCWWTPASARSPSATWPTSWPPWATSPAWPSRPSGRTPSRPCTGSEKGRETAIMINSSEILQTVQMFNQQHLDIRTITMGISLLDCAGPQSPGRLPENLYDKICRRAEHLAITTGAPSRRSSASPLSTKRVSVTPISLVAAASDTNDYVPSPPP